MNKNFFVMLCLFFPSILMSQWIETNTGTVKTIWCISELANDTLVVGGSFGTILKSTNGGDDWIQKNTPVPWQIYSVDFKDKNTGIAVGEFKNILRTTNGGQNWSAMVQTDNTWLTRIKYINDTTIMTIGFNGVVWKSIDGGTTWPSGISNTLNTTKDLRDLWIFNDSTILIVGERGYLFKSTDIGSSWTLDSINISDDIRAVHFNNDLDGFIVGDNGLAYKTNDGGQNWSSMALPTSQALFAVNFGDSNNGLIVGDGVIFKTIDAGVSWYIQDYDNKTLLTDILFVTNDEIYVTGAEGTILKTNNGGNVSVNEHSTKNSFFQYYYNSQLQQLKLTKIIQNVATPFQIHDANGRIIKEGVIRDTSPINLQNLSSGFYLFSIYDQEHPSFSKIVKY